MSEPLISLSGVSVKVRENTLLSDVSFSVRDGERVAVLGANGAGKSTLLRICNALLLPSSGTANVPSPIDQALIFQRPLLLKRSALENVSFALLARGIPKHVAIRAASEALEACGLSAFTNRYARSLSGGEQQKLALARAWALSPKLLLADEPTASLAPAAVHAVEAIFQSMAERGTSYVFATHNRGQAKRLATRVVFLADGCIVEDRPVQDFFSNPQSAAAIEYLNVEKV